MRGFLRGVLLGILIGWLILMPAVEAQHLERTTPFAGGPSGQGFLGDFDSGMTVVPSSSTVVTTSTVVISVVYCHNVTILAQTITLTDNQGSPMTYIPAVSIPPFATQLFINTGKGVQMKGFKWSATGTNAILCVVSGYF